MRGILIDPYEKCVSEVQYNGDWESISSEHLSSEHRQVDTFTVIGIGPVSLFLDDTGWMFEQDTQQYWWLQGYPQLLAGKGLLLGCDHKTGETIALPKEIMVDRVFEAIKWQAKETAMAFEPPPPTVVPMPADFFDKRK